MAEAEVSPPPSSLPALMITIKQRIGSGQFGTVHLAESTTGEILAVKRIKASSMKSAKHVQNLDREVKLLQDARHPNVVRLFGVKRRPDEFWLILEYCGGGDLHQFIRSRQPKPRLSEAVSLHFFRQLASGLDFMASSALIHRDLKPANLLLSASAEDAVLKIADFGFARSLAGDALAQTQCGSPLYMAPEILDGLPHDHKVDLYSAGAILFEMLAGRPPFGGENIAELRANQCKGELKLPLTPSKPCRDVIRALLQRQPQRRAGADDLLRSEWLAGPAQPSSARSPAPGPGYCPGRPEAGGAGAGSAAGQGAATAGVASAGVAPAGALDASVVPCGWEVVPSQSLLVAEALMRDADRRSRAVLAAVAEDGGCHGGGGEAGGPADLDLAATLLAIGEASSAYRRATEHFGAAGEAAEVSRALARLQRFLAHPAVDAALSRSVSAEGGAVNAMVQPVAQPAVQPTEGDGAGARGIAASSASLEPAEP